ncbi:hypothetical protein COCOBI_06-2150 [Coccomyxa sp. Obi]|nr:hypothetical protein COCOBI_06-2150 [Coccomyxa sp. Obi]
MERFASVVLVLGVVLHSSRNSGACSVLEFHMSGLAAHVNGLWNALPALYGSNGSIYIDSENFPYKCTEGGGWSDFFVTEPGFLEQWSPEVARKESCSYYTYGEMSRESQIIGISHVQSRFDPGMVRKSWKLQPSVQKEVDAALATLDGYAKPTIAFHVRGGDKATEDVVLGRKTTRPVDLINTYLDSFQGMRGGTCVLIGDDHDAIAETGKLAWQHIGCTVVRPSKYYRNQGHHQGTFNSLPLQERCKETIQLIKDLEMMAHADYFVGSSTSGIPHIIATLRMTVYLKSQVTFADVSYDDMGARIRRHFGIGGFKNVTVGMAAQRKHSQRRMLAVPL